MLRAECVRQYQTFENSAHNIQVPSFGQLNLPRNPREIDQTVKVKAGPNSNVGNQLGRFQYHLAVLPANEA
jgi:hypothetical protein